MDNRTLPLHTAIYGLSTPMRSCRSRAADVDFDNLVKGRRNVPAIRYILTERKLFEIRAKNTIKYGKINSLVTLRQIPRTRLIDFKY